MPSFLFFLFLIFCSNILFSQTCEKINVSLHYFIRSHSPEKMVTIPVKLSHTSLLNELPLYDAKAGISAQGWQYIYLPTGKIEALAKDPRIEKIYFTSAKGSVLNDTMVINNNVLAIHNGSAPLNKIYKGKGIVMGMIDTGIEINHPDFKNTDGSTRIVKLWDHTQAYDGINPYGYGRIWDSTEINLGLCTHDDQAQYYGHGSIVTGIAAGNGNAVGKFEGVAPQTDIVAVALDFNSPNWEMNVAEATHFIYATADSLQKPCAINASVGTYSGSHDGTDPGALVIDSLIKAANGRAFVCAAGNAGHVFYHLGYSVTSDTNFTWFQVNNGSTVMGVPGVAFELWADTLDFNNVQFALGADQVSPTYSFRGRTNFDNIKNRLNITYNDTIKNNMGQKIAHLQTWAETFGDKYFLQVFIPQPDSNQYAFRLELTGNGKFDIWSDNWLGFAKMTKSGLPNPGQFPPIVYYKEPDTLKTIVGSFSCLPSTITVANYTNRSTYLDYNNALQTMAYTPGAKSATSSIGPSRIGLQKPDIAASGDITLSSSRLATVAAMIIAEPFKVAQGGMHNRNGGTSLASPVVAGTAALYLEKCPHANWLEIKQAITGTAKTDGFTGFVPNYSWGAGKIDAMATLSSSLFNINITLSNDTLYATQGYVSYQWYVNGNFIPGATQAFYKISQQGFYTVEVINNSGCSSSSASFPVGLNENKAHSRIKIYPNPANNTLLIDVEDKTNYLFEMYDLLGNIQLNASFNASVSIDISALAEGIYFVKVFSENKKIDFTYKIMKE